MKGRAAVPPASETQVELQRAIDQGHHRADVFAKIGKCQRGIGQDVGVVPRSFQSSPRKVRALSAVRLGVIAPAVDGTSKMAHSSPSKGGAKLRIALDRLAQKAQRLRDLLGRRQKHCAGAQIEIIGCQIGCRPLDRAGGLGSL